MSKAYPSNLTHAQYEFLSDMIPEPKSGGRPREVEMREVLNAIVYVLVEPTFRTSKSSIQKLHLRVMKN